MVTSAVLPVVRVEESAVGREACDHGGGADNRKINLECVHSSILWRFGVEAGFAWRSSRVREQDYGSVSKRN
jgi:hypothetical protein